jgi:hypothetical protein
LKALLSLTVCIVAGVMLWYERGQGASAIGWLAVALGALMVLGIWVFPEARRDDKQGKGSA